MMASPKHEATSVDPAPKIQEVAAYGDVEAMAKMAKFNPSITNSPDEQGYFPLQWCALNNRVRAIVWLLENGADVHAADSQKQTALHWAAVRGCNAAAHVLHASGADSQARDVKGYTPMHVAAQYGHTSFLYHLTLHCGVEVDACDADGRSPLHWAAYKGFANCVRFLLFCDADPCRQDQEGCTPLHWATIKGNGEAVAVLVEAGGSRLLDLTENTNSTAADLATQKNHADLSVLLRVCKARMERSGWEVKFPFKHLYQVPTHYCLYAGTIFMVVAFIHLVVIFPEGPPRAAHQIDAFTALVAWLAVCLASASLLFLLRASTLDPGYISRASETSRSKGGDDSHRSLADLHHPALQAGCWHQICPKCKIVQPVRARHCTQCRRCVRVFDQHCSLIGNCIGAHNRRDVLLCTVLAVLAMGLAAGVAGSRLMQLHRQEQTIRHAPWLVAWLAGDLIGLCFTVVLALIKLYEAAKNITSYEMVSKESCTYLMAPDGQFSNPFDKGIVRNLQEILSDPLHQVEVVCMDAPEMDARSVTRGTQNKAG